MESLELKINPYYSNSEKPCQLS